MIGALVAAGVAMVVPGLTAAPAPLQELAVEPSPENVTASQLGGAWVIDEPLAERLLGAEGATTRVRAATFRPDATVVERIPGRLVEFFGEHRIYQAGILTGLAQEAPYVLIEMNGGPRLLFFRDVDGISMAETESFNLFVARAAAREDDLLFVGGDSGDEPFAPFRRHVSERAPNRAR